MESKLGNIFGMNKSNIEEIDINKIRPSRYQPRLHFDEEALQELAESIKANGLIQPITVRQIGDGYEIIAGERRTRASKLAGLEKIPCYILSPDESQAAEMALVENIQRENLSAIEEAKAYIEIMRQSGMTQEEVAKRVGKSQSAVANKIRLLNLTQDVQDAVKEHRLSERHARALLALPPDQQSRAAKYIEDKGFNVRQTEQYVENMTGNKPKKRKQITKGYSKNTQIGINSVNQCIQMIQKMGIEVTSTTDETDTEVRMTIRFPRT